MQVTISAARDKLSELIEAARGGEEVVLADGETPVAKLVPITQPIFKFDSWRGKIAPPPDDFFDPLSAEERALWDGDA